MHFFFFHLTQNQVSDLLHSSVRNKCGEHGPPRLPEVLCKAKDDSLLASAQMCADADGDRPEGPGSHKTAVAHHEWLADHAHSYRPRSIREGLSTELPMPPPRL